MVLHCQGTAYERSPACGPYSLGCPAPRISRSLQAGRQGRGEVVQLGIECIKENGVE